MQLGQSMSMRMDQRQILTPRMIQSMEILQLPLMALEERVEQELQANPVLEIKATSDPVASRAEAAAPDMATENGRLTQAADGPSADEFSRLDRIAEYLENEEYSPAYRPRQAADSGEERFDAIANSAARSGSLLDHLIDQWRMIDTLPDLRQAGRAIIDHIEPDGYLRTPLADIAASSNVPIDRLQIALRLVQQLDPSGVGARSLSECLMLQLDALEDDEEYSEGHDFDLERRLIRDHIKDLELNRYPQIARATGRPIDELKRAVRRLGRLNPAPGRAFGIDEAPPITPDAEVFLNEETGRYDVRMRSDPSDNLYIRKRYRAMLADKSVEKTTREFLADKLRSARWLIEAIQQRASTIARVIRIVVDQQQEFFEKGPEYLRPLPMIQVADMLGIHVATVSRAVSEKWIQTPVGVFPLRRFFSMGTTDASGQEMSWNAVQEKIRKIIDEEDKQNPLNDDEIVEAAKKQGIDLARRTVAKYRKLLNIPTARQRRAY